MLEELVGSGDECTQVSLHARFKEDGSPNMVTRWDIVFELLDGFEDKGGAWSPPRLTPKGRVPISSNLEQRGG